MALVARSPHAPPHHSFSRSLCLLLGATLSRHVLPRKVRRQPLRAVHQRVAHRRSW
jgi:hypothetical protein